MDVDPLSCTHMTTMGVIGVNALYRGLFAARGSIEAAHCQGKNKSRSLGV